MNLRDIWWQENTFQPTAIEATCRDVFQVLGKHNLLQALAVPKCAALYSLQRLGQSHVLYRTAFENAIVRISLRLVLLRSNGL